MGSVALVTPVRFRFEGGGSLPAFGTLVLRFAPEPRAPALLLGGVLALWLLSRRSRPSKRPGRS
jgi:hypothetical protein